MKKTTRSPTSRSGIQEGTSGTESSGRKSLWEMRAEGESHEEQNPGDFFYKVLLGNGGGRRLRRPEKRLLRSSGTGQHPAGCARRAPVEFELPGFGLSGACFGPYAWGWA